MFKHATRDETSLEKRVGGVLDILLAVNVHRIFHQKPPIDLNELYGNLLRRNLLAAQDGSAPNNHKESKSNSAPKPLLWLKIPKLLLLGKNKTSFSFQTKQANQRAGGKMDHFHGLRSLQKHPSRSFRRSKVRDALGSCYGER